MSKLIVDSTTSANLRSATPILDLCDPNGRSLGKFIPASSLEPKVSEAELDRREKAGGGRRLSEILADLEKQT